MAATQADIRGWLLEAKLLGCSHVIVMCDTFDYDDYPVKVMPTDNVRAVLAIKRNGDMQKVMEVYNLSMDIQSQLDETRAYNL